MLFSVNTSTSGPILSQKMRLLERRVLEGESNICLLLYIYFYFKILLLYVYTYVYMYESD